MPTRIATRISAEYGLKLFYEGRGGMGRKWKYEINFHDGIKTHDDGSAFYDLRTFANKATRDQFVSDLRRQGYRYRTEWPTTTVSHGHLMDAAPDLLAALQEIIALPDLNYEPTDTAREAIKQAKAAIAKATKR